jgi:hypothetical protein
MNKKQPSAGGGKKTLVPRDVALTASRPAVNRRFLVLFFKKELLPSSQPLRLAF